MWISQWGNRTCINTRPGWRNSELFDNNFVYSFHILSKTTSYLSSLYSQLIFIVCIMRPRQNMIDYKEHNKRYGWSITIMVSNNEISVFSFNFLPYLYSNWIIYARKMLIQNSTNSFWLSHVISSFYLTFFILSYIFLQRFLFLDQLSFPLFPLYHSLPNITAPTNWVHLGPSGVWQWRDGHSRVNINIYCMSLAFASQGECEPHSP